MDRAEGKVQDSIKVSGDTEQPLEVIFKYATNGDSSTTIAPETETDQNGEKA
jgi:hypothetical protein